LRVIKKKKEEKDLDDDGHVRQPLASLLQEMTLRI